MACKNRMPRLHKANAETEINPEPGLEVITTLANADAKTEALRVIKKKAPAP